MLVLLHSPDLMLRSQLEAAARRHGHEFRQEVEAAPCGPDEEPVGLVLIDLGQAEVDLPATVAAWHARSTPPQVVAFGPHVHASRLQAAQDAGCDLVLTRGQLLAGLEPILAQ